MTQHTQGPTNRVALTFFKEKINRKTDVRHTNRGGGLIRMIFKVCGVVEVADTKTNEYIREVEALSKKAFIPVYQGPSGS
jgi:hypothetical protein